MAPDPHILKLHEPGALPRAVACLRAGGIVGVPTESVYGLAVRADDAAAVARLCALKGREPHKPLPLVAADVAAVRAACHLPGPFESLATALWPGPLTLGLPAYGSWPEAVLGPGNTLGVRVSAHPVLEALCRGVGGLLTATSANFAGEAPAQTLASLPAELRRQALWLDGGTLPGGLPSTVVVLSAEGRLHVARPGAVPLGRLQAVAGAHAFA
jgi:L-threonylcarbamoyladenylate synthase